MLVKLKGKTNISFKLQFLLPEYTKNMWMNVVLFVQLPFYELLVRWNI